MQADSEDTAIGALSRHQRRREGGIPTLSVLVGPPELAVAAWKVWAGSAGRRACVVRSRGPDAAERVAVAWMSQPWILDRLLDHAAHGLQGPPERLRELLRGGACRERSLLRDRLIAACSSRALESLCRRVLADDPSVAPVGSRGSDAAGWLEGLSLIDGDCAPGFLVAADGGTEDTARSLADLIERCPRLPVGWALPAAGYAGFMALEPSSRVRTLCREGVVAVPDRSGRALPDAVEVEARREEARAARQRVHEGPEAEEAARSAAEAFLHGVLESLPETAGLFELNGRIPADWGPHGEAEVDLLCRSGKLAVEIDGYFHFCEPDGYRRDRQKDVVLQKQGFLVLRFLADDVVAGLETILDTILASLQWRQDTGRGA
jgi:hypothetical protein